MDTVGSWLHNANIDRTLERLGAYVDPATRANLFKYLIAQEAEIGDGPHQLNETARRIHEGRARIDRATIIIEGLLDNGLMNVAKFSKAMAVLTTLQDSQVLLEQLHRRMSEVAALETRRLLFLRKFDWNACSNKEFFTPADSPRRPLNKFLVQTHNSGQLSLVVRLVRPVACLLLAGEPGVVCEVCCMSRIEPGTS